LYMLLMLLGLNLVYGIGIVGVLGLLRWLLPEENEFYDHRAATGLQRLWRLPWLLAAPFYTRRDDGSARLNSRGFTVSGWLHPFAIFFLGCFAVEALLSAGCILWANEIVSSNTLHLLQNWNLLPMASFLLVQQFLLMLEGEPEEGAVSLFAARVRQTQKGSLKQLYNVYPQLFRGSQALLLQKESGQARRRKSGLGLTDLSARQLADCANPDVLQVIHGQLVQIGAGQEEAYRNALVELVNGNSVNVCADSTGDFLPVLAAYLNFHLAQGKTALVLCEDASGARELCACLQEQMRKLNRLAGMWSICTAEQIHDERPMGVLVCTADTFLEQQICEKRRDFAEALFCAVVTDGMALFSRDSIRIGRLFGQLTQLPALSQYVLLSDVNNEALRGAMEQVCKRELLPFQNDHMQPDTYVLVWREESQCRLQDDLFAGNEISPYLGTALPLALAAARHDLPQVYIQPAGGYKSFDHILTSYEAAVMQYLRRDADLKRLIRYEQADPQELTMRIAYDTDYNFLNTLWRQLRSGGTRQTLLHIVSPPYMLREYFAANYETLKNNEFDAMIPHHLGMRASRMGVLLTALCGAGMTRRELLEKSREYGWDYTTVEALLSDCLSVVLTDRELHSIHESFRFEDTKRFSQEENRYVADTRVLLTDSTIRSRLQQKIAYTSLVTPDDRHMPLPILRTDVRNHYLRGQQLCHGGLVYRVTDIRGGNVYIRPEQDPQLPTYHPITDLVFEDFRLADQWVDPAGLDMNICTARVTRRIWGYWSCSRGNSLAQDAIACDLRELSGQPLTDSFPEAGVLQLRMRRSSLGEKPVEAARLLAYMLKELSKTLFPATWQNLYVAMEEGHDAELYSRVLTQGKDSEPSEAVCSLIPLVTGAPAGDPEFVCVYVAELSGVEYGMVQTLCDNFPKVLRMVRQYLTWYETGGSYLRFGWEQLPQALDIPGVLALCGRLLAEQGEARERASAEKGAGHITCSFCGNETMFPQALADGRHMCAQCQDRQIAGDRAIGPLLEETQRILEEGYGISLPRDIRIRVQSAAVIARAVGSTGERVLSYYAPTERVLALEASGPRTAMQSALIRELANAWQYTDRSYQSLLSRALRRFPRERRGEVERQLREGFAAYVEIDAMEGLHEAAYAELLHKRYANATDACGIGYNRIGMHLTELAEAGSHITPFKAMCQLLTDVAEGRLTL